MKEEWRVIPEYSKYEASSLGRIRNYKTKYVIGQTVDHNGYIHCILSYEKPVCAKVHKLVLLAFIGPRPPGFEGCHYDGVRTNNKLSNLNWVTPEENRSHKKLHGTHGANEKHSQAKFTNKQVEQIRAAFKKSGRFSNARELAKKYSVHKSTITRIVYFRHYKMEGEIK